MKKILIVTVKPNSAIDNLAGMVQKYNPHLDIKILPVHPKRPDNLNEYKKLAEWADVIDYEYWKSAEMLRAKFPEIKKPIMLSHYNPYDIKQRDWKNYNILVAPNKIIQNELKLFTNRNIEYIPLSVDLKFWQWNDEEYDTKIKRVLMISQRIEGKKGIREVARACYELGYEFVLVGLISSQAYFDQIINVNPNTQWMSWVSNEDLRDLYWNASFHVCNSLQNFESGTLPILEAMACGCPVLTQNIGHVPDLDNLEIINGQAEDYERVKLAVKLFMNDKEKRLEAREKAWETVKALDAYRRAKTYAKLYNKVYFGEHKLVSVIIPSTYDRINEIKQILEAVEKQSYENMEVIICFDEKKKDNVLSAFDYNFPIKIVYTDKNEKYGLAKARNLGVLEADGKYLLFCDSRLCPSIDAVNQFVYKIDNKKKVWLYGNKGKGEKPFVENWSFIKRQDLINAGMFNERIIEYGGMTQEVRSRFGRQGIEFIYVDEAQCFEIKSASKRGKERKNQIVRMKNLLWQLNL